MWPLRVLRICLNKTFLLEHIVDPSNQYRLKSVERSRFFICTGHPVTHGLRKPCGFNLTSIVERFRSNEKYTSNSREEAWNSKSPSILLLACRPDSVGVLGKVLLRTVRRIAFPLVHDVPCALN